MYYILPKPKSEEWAFESNGDEIVVSATQYNASRGLSIHSIDFSRNGKDETIGNAGDVWYVFHNVKNVIQNHMLPKVAPKLIVIGAETEQRIRIYRKLVARNMDEAGYRFIARDNIHPNMQSFFDDIEAATLYYFLLEKIPCSQHHIRMP